MKRYKIIHHTAYHFSQPVELRPHTLRLRPRDGHELRIESSKLDINPAASLRWHRDVEGNSVLIADFSEISDVLIINSEIVIQQYDLEPLDFLVADYAVNYPFSYLQEDLVLLAPYMFGDNMPNDAAFTEWIRALWQPGERIQSVVLLQRLNERINQSIGYQVREEEGVQTAEKTLRQGSGSCRDLANLFMQTAQALGFSVRFVSGYLYSGSDPAQPGSTHAWAEVFIPGAGWKGFDPTLGDIVGPHHIAVAVARIPESVPPVAGAFLGATGAAMTVDVRVLELAK